MPSFWVRKTASQSLAATDDEGREYLKGLALGEPVMVTVKKPRNGKFHRKYFALLGVAFENQDKYEDREAFRAEVIMRAGYWVEHVHVSGKVSYTAKSISFASMDELEFSELYRKSVDVIINYFMPGMEPGELDRAVNEVLNFV